MNLNHIFIAGFACAMCACKPSADNNVSGKLANLVNDTLVVYSNPFEDERQQLLKLDTVIVAKDGKFAFNVSGNELKNITIVNYPKGENHKPIYFMKQVKFTFVPGEKVEINGSFDDYSVTGSRFYKELHDVQQTYADKQEMMNRLQDSIRAEIAKGVPGDIPIAKYGPKLRECGLGIRDTKVNYIKEHLQDNVSLYLLYKSGATHEDQKIIFEGLSEEVKNGPLNPIYRMLKSGFDAEEQRHNAEKMTQVGNEVPDFTLVDIKGKKFSLSSLKGKYVILDFWASWCGACIKGMPELKKSYDKYRGKLEVVGIACYDKDKDWRNKVKELDLKWTNVRSEEDPNIPVMFGVNRFPTKIIVGPDGKVLKRQIGEAPSFYLFLDEYIK